MRLRRHATLGLCLALLAGCAPPAGACGDGSRSAALVQLAFGMNVGRERRVSEAAFRRFLDEQVSPRFPAGLTVVDGQGRWQAADGAQIEEASKVVTLVTTDRPDTRAKIDEIRQAYTRTYRQDSVLLLAQQACVSF